MDSMNDLPPHNPTHGTRIIHRHGKLEYIDLCQCHKTERPLISSEAHVSNVEGVLNAFHRHISDMETKLNSLSHELRAHSAVLEDHVNQIEEAVKKITDQHHSILTETLNKHQEAIEKITLWSLIKKCFQRS